MKHITLMVLVGYCLLGQMPDILAQNQVKKVKIEELKALISTKDEQVKVLNFWATWCRPCIQELPYFEKAHQTFDEAEVKVYLIAIEDELEKVQAFIQKKGITAEVWLLDEKDPNAWIPQIYDKWGGDIPVTIFLHQDEMLFHQGIYPEEKLLAQIRSYLR